MDDKAVLRARDFWTALVLLAVSVFFLIQTTDIPFLNTKSAGVDSAEWYNSAALVPFGIFGSLLLLSLVLLGVAVRDGGASRALAAAGIGLDGPELRRLTAIAIILFCYIFGLVPRVDFIIASALMITCLIWGFHGGSRSAMLISTFAIMVPALYAAIVHFGRDEWAKPHDDDWVALGAYVVLTAVMFWHARRKHAAMGVVRITPVVAILCPLILVLAMAFGFRQNVPNRTGLLFKQIEYHYYVTVKPLFQGK
ncbi:hypothetical protein [Pelagibius sp. Alg239-R121]|uniref:hypothetical protein n=1 Tax=Pelagibius sp. Alg239-R121 TaxID=2993448 RepID=UPI0024A702E0|nr:hypothetical protein [Pelagibius sp. Alg239-R121]